MQQARYRRTENRRPRRAKVLVGCPRHPTALARGSALLPDRVPHGLLGEARHARPAPAGRRAAHRRPAGRLWFPLEQLPLRAPKRLLMLPTFLPKAVALIQVLRQPQFVPY